MAQNSLMPYQLLAIGGSAGSLDVVMKIIAALPPQTGAAVLVVLHRKAASDSALVHIFGARTALMVKEVEDKEALLPGTIYIAPPDYHLLLEDAQNFSLDASEKVHHSRPSIDVTFESVAEVFGAAAIGILLSGANADGAEGLLKISLCGGYTIVQDPATADVGYMPQKALSLSSAHTVVPTASLPGVVARLLTP